MAKLTSATGVRGLAPGSAASILPHRARQDGPGPASRGVTGTAVRGLRILAAVAIMSNHWMDYHVVGRIPQQQIAVDFFFAAEGLLAGQALVLAGDAASAAVTIWQRVIRLYPLYLLGLVAGAAMADPLARVAAGGWTAERVWQAVLAGTVGLPTFSLLAGGAVFPLNPPSWAIVLELWAFALLCLFRSRLDIRALAGLCAAAAVALGCFAVLRHDMNPGWETRDYWGGIPRVTFSFFSGVLLAGLAGRPGRREPRIGAVAIWAVFVLVLFLKIHLVGLPLLFIVMPLTLYLAIPATCPAWLDGIVRKAERHCYAFYLLHYPVLAAFHAIGADIGLSERRMASAASYVLALAGVAAVAVLATRCVDDPIRRRFAFAPALQTNRG